MESHVLSDAVLRSSFAQFVHRPGNLERIERWLWYPHSAEKWFEFEFLFALDGCCGGGMRVAAERRAPNGTIPDLGIYTLSQTDIILADVVQKQTPAAVIELKMIGNWYLDKRTVNEIKNDVCKIDNFIPTPGIALVFATIVEPTTAIGQHRWIPDCIRQCGVRAEADLHQRLQNGCSPAFYKLAEECCCAGDTLGTVKLCLYGYRNVAARQEGI